mmetsp:Transcript_29597/g.34057  ORF Transcript_29597/g.34057 Transcript_29597/m.34057 type:complete len:278 (-) Transcript_29597:731-1564(-)
MRFHDSILPQSQRIIQRLIHIKILIIRQPSRKNNLTRFFQFIRQLPVFRKQFLIPIVGHGIIRIPHIARGFLDHDRVRRFLFEEIFVFDRPGEIRHVHTGIIHDRFRQDVAVGVVMPLLREFDRSVFQLLHPRLFEIPIDRSRVHNRPARLLQMLLVLEEINIHRHVDLGVIEEMRKPRRVPLAGERLVLIAEIPWVESRSDRNPCRHERIEILRFLRPLLEGILPEDLLVQSHTHATLRHLLGILAVVIATTVGARDLHAREPRLHLVLRLDGRSQ